MPPNLEDTTIQLRLEAQETDAAAAHETLVKALLGTLIQSQTAKEFQENWQRIAKNLDTLFTTEGSIDTLKQTIIQLAVMGKISSQMLKDLPAIDFLKQLKNEKAKSIDGSRLKKPKPAVTINGEERPFDLPGGWTWCFFGDLWESSFYGPRFGADEYVKAGGIPTIRTTDMTEDGNIVLGV